ncbi:aldose 1-epimerase [Xylariales sp. PMI_506]|nr:aldose 1-epimerase [Xylariales sp. PMI_506]
MVFRALLLLATCVVATSPIPAFSGDPFQRYSLSANGINATWIPYGARLTNLFVADKNGTMQDIVIGYDNATDYVSPRTYYGAVVGRYANRIKNATFELDGVTYHTPIDENNVTTLHGGTVGYDERNWTVVSQNASTITFMFYDEALEGFPGDVLNLATYTLTDEPAFISRLVSVAIDQATPIMLANHIYWNLGAFVNEDALLILNDTLQMRYADRYINIDGIEVPTGNISLTADTPLDFTQPKEIGADIADTLNNCGTGCTGYDNAFILDRPRYALDDPYLEVLTWSNPITGITMHLETNQQGLQIYTCNTLDGTTPVKADQQHGLNSTYEQYGCMVIETQDWIDGINYPQWGRDEYQIFSPTSQPFVNLQKYRFEASS